MQAGRVSDCDYIKRPGSRNVGDVGLGLGLPAFPLRSPSATKKERQFLWRFPTWCL